MKTKTSLKYLLIFIMAMGSFTISKGIGRTQNVPVTVVMVADGGTKTSTNPKKGKKKKGDDDKLKRNKKPADLNKSKRAEKEPVYHPRTIIVV